MNATRIHLEYLYMLETIIRPSESLERQLIYEFVKDNSVFKKAQKIMQRMLRRRGILLQDALARRHNRVHSHMLLELKDPVFRIQYMGQRIDDGFQNAYLRGI